MNIIERTLNNLKKWKNRNKEFKIIFYKNIFKVRSFNGNESIEVFRDIETDTLIINMTGNISLNVNGELNVSSKDELNITSFKDTNIDTWNSKLNLNCRKSSHIKDHPDAIKYRDEVEAKIIEFKKKQIEYENEKLKHINKSDELKMEDL